MNVDHFDKRYQSQHDISYWFRSAPKVGCPIDEMMNPQNRQIIYHQLQTPPPTLPDIPSSNSQNTKNFKYNKKIVFICSPYRGTISEISENICNAQQYCKIAISENCIPIAPHLYFPQMLEDNKQNERCLGIEFGLQLLQYCDELWYWDYPTQGMKKEIEYAKKLNKKIILRYGNEKLEYDFCTNCSTKDKDFISNFHDNYLKLEAILLEKTNQQLKRIQTSQLCQSYFKNEKEFVKVTIEDQELTEFINNFRQQFRDNFEGRCSYIDLNFIFVNKNQISFYMIVNTLSEKFKKDFYGEIKKEEQQK